MAESDTNSIQAMLYLCPCFDGKDKVHFLDYKDKLRVVLSFHWQSVAAILQGDPKPPVTQNPTAVAMWERANENLFSILFFTTERSANNVVKRHMGKTREDGVGNGQAAWNALEEKYNSHTKEARRAYHEKLHSTKMEAGDDPDDFLYTMDGFRERLEDMGQPVPDERYEDIILQALPAEYERVRTSSYERRDFHLADIRRMMSALYIDCLSRPNNSSLVAGRGVAMQAIGGDDSAIKCHYCGNPGHRQKNCVAWIAAQCRNGNQQTTRSTPLGRWKRKAGGDGKPMWCSFHKSTTHSDETCRTLQQQMGNNGSANCANQGSDYPAVLTASDPPPGCTIEEQGISFAAVEVPTRDEPPKEESFWPLGPTGDEAIASFDTSGWFSESGGANSEETEGSIFEIEEGLVQRLGVSSHIIDILTTLARALVLAVMLHYVWFTLGSPPYNRVASTNTTGQPETFGGSTDAEDGLALAALPAAEKWNRGSNSLVSVMVDSGVSGHYFDDALIPGLRYRLYNYQALAIRRWITTTGGHQLKEADQGLPRSHSIGAQGLKHLTQLSVLAGPGAGWGLSAVKQDGALSGGGSLSGNPECGKPREQPASLGEASPAGGVPQDGVLEHSEQPMSSDCEHVEAPFARSLSLQRHGPSCHQVTPAATRTGNATQSIKKRNDNDCTRLAEVAPDSTLSQLRGLGLDTEASFTDIARQTDEAESVVEYTCAATNDQMYLVGEETEVVPNTFEEATITGSRWVYKINAEKSIGQPRLVPTALERPSPLRRGTLISAPEKSTSGTEPASTGMPNTDDRDLGRRVDNDKRGTGTDDIENGAMDHEKGGEDVRDPQEGELRRGQRRDEPTERAKITFKRLVGIAAGELAVGPTCHLNNGDEANVPNFAGQFHKSLPHDEVGRVDPEAYQMLLDCIESNDINVCDQVPSGVESDGRKLVNPLGGGGHQVDGADSDNIFIKQPDNLLSERLAAQQAEVYWMALLRDTPFSQFGTNNDVQMAAANLQGFDAFNGLSISRGADGNIDPMQDLFRTDWPGVSSGPMVSQFMLADFDIDGIVVEPKAKTLVPEMEYMTGVDTWLNIQNGGPAEDTLFVDDPLFIRNGRDLAALAFNDVLYTEALRTILVLFNDSILAEAGPYGSSTRQEGFTTLGTSHYIHAMAAGSSSTRHAWYAKWQVHRVLRPEAYGGLLHFVINGELEVPLPASIVNNTELLNAVESLNQAQNGGTNQVFLLPMAVGEGSPVHPAYPSGHAINLGAYITVLKAFLGFELGQRCFPSPMISNDAGTDRIPFVPSDGDRVGTCINKEGEEEVGLTYEGELNKVTSNVAIGRSHLGVHWRMDGVFGAEMGEAGAIRRLQQELGGLPEARDTEGPIPSASYKFRLYSGTMIELFPDNRYMLGDQMCKGFFTGDDFCIPADEEETAGLEDLDIGSVVDQTFAEL